MTATTIPASAVVLADTIDLDQVTWRVAWRDHEAFAAAVLDPPGFRHPKKEGLYAIGVKICGSGPPRDAGDGLLTWDEATCTVEFAPLPDDYPLDSPGTFLGRCSRCGKDRPLRMTADPFVVEGISEGDRGEVHAWCKPCLELRRDDV